MICTPRGRLLGGRGGGGNSVGGCTGATVEAPRCVIVGREKALAVRAGGWGESGFGAASAHGEQKRARVSGAPSGVQGASSRAPRVRALPGRDARGAVPGPGARPFPCWPVGGARDRGDAGFIFLDRYSQIISLPTHTVLKNQRTNCPQRSKSPHFHR